jgi:hypothetical protein
MKRISVPPDLLASMTADALFDRRNERRAAPDVAKPTSTFRLGQWFKPRKLPRAATKGSPATLDDDWVGGWYARTRELQAATLANSPERKAARTDSAATAVEGGSEVTAGVVTPTRDLS